MLKSSFKERGQAKLDRLDQDDMQRMCSEYQGKPMPKDVSDKLEKAQQALIKYPADGNLMGDFRSGERIAQSGQGMQFNDNPANPAGANCYACHQLSKAELSFGTIGPPLYNFGKIRGFTPEMQKEFNGDDRFFPITYKDAWKVVREIAEGSGTPYNKAAFEAEAKREAEALAKKQQEQAAPKQ